MLRRSGQIRIGFALSVICAICFHFNTALSQEGDEVTQGDLEQDEPKESQDSNRWEWAFLPIVSGNSDIGFAFGSLLVLAKFDEDYSLYRWRGKLKIKMSVKKGPDGLALPFHDHLFNMDFPQFANDRLRLYTTFGLKKNTIAGYYGLGNQSLDEQDSGDRRNQYRTLIPYAELALRIQVVRYLTVFVRGGYKYYFIKIYPGSKLEEDVANLSNSTELFGTSNYGHLEFSVGPVYDSRNDETNPLKGAFHELSVRGSPGLLTGSDHNYAGLNLSLRHFVPIAAEYLVLASRFTLDLLDGDVPFTELESVGGLKPYPAFSGPKGVRGIPAGRYHGKVKAFGSLELRSIFLHHTIKSAHFALGAVLFFDAGRLWSDFRSNPELDGQGMGLKFGTGGGLRVLWGKTFVISMDVAYSPDAHPVGIYIETGHAF